MKENNKLVIIQGIPGSGKSTYARKLYRTKRHQYFIVNRDDIRSMLGDYWIPSRESIVTEIEDNLIRTGLNNKYNVIIDATNLNPKTLKRFEDLAKEFKVDVEYKKVIINPKKAYLRVLWRTLWGGRYISYKVISGFYNRYFSNEIKK